MNGETLRQYIERYNSELDNGGLSNGCNGNPVYFISGDQITGKGHKFYRFDTNKVPRDVDGQRFEVIPVRRQCTDGEIEKESPVGLFLEPHLDDKKISEGRVEA